MHQQQAELQPTWRITNSSYTHQNISKLRHAQQKQIIISSRQAQQPSAYYCLRKGSPAPSSKPALVHFSLEPRRRRSTALIRDICTCTRTKLVTEDKGRHHLAESCADTHLKKAWNEAWATPSTAMTRGQKVARRSSAATLYFFIIIIFSRAWLLRTLL